MFQENFCELEKQLFRNSSLYQYFKKKKKREREAISDGTPVLYSSELGVVETTRNKTLACV